MSVLSILPGGPTIRCTRRGFAAMNWPVSFASLRVSNRLGLHPPLPLNPSHPTGVPFGYDIPFEYDMLREGCFPFAPYAPFGCVARGMLREGRCREAKPLGRFLAIKNVSIFKEYHEYSIK
jgi:hypothetical protein